MKLPHFFKYAKDKEDKQVNEINNSTVNMLEDIIPNKSIQFKKVAGECDYKLFMKDVNVAVDLEITDKFTDINRRKCVMTKFEGFNDDGFNQYLKKELSKFNTDESYISDVLVKHFFEKDSAFKSTLWECYGEFIYENLLLNIGNTFCCERCSERVDKKKEKQIYCDSCAKEIDREKARIRMMEKRKLKKCSI